MKYITPIQKIGCCDMGINLYIKRDDLLPLSFGGNKARIAEEYYRDMIAKEKNCMIGYGDMRSNLCRVLANICSIGGQPFHIVSPSDGEYIKTSNSTLAQWCGAVIHTCDREHIAQTVENVMSDCSKSGLSPYYINGNKFGKGNEAVPVYAYARAYDEISEQSASMGIEFDYIFLATGTGMTQAGLLAGKHRRKGREQIIGISIARSAEKEAEVIDRYLSVYADETGGQRSSYSDICVEDGYLCGGYGKYNDEIADTVIKVYQQTGIALDPVYTGKAFYGMCRYLKEHKLHNKNILFIHTGSAPLLFDFVRDYKKKPEIKKCREHKRLEHFLRQMDERLPVSLSERVDISEYSKKLISCGNVICIESNGAIVSAAMFYCNDRINRQAYLSFLGTLSGNEKKGYAKALIKEAERIAKDAGMASFHLDTEPENTNAVAFYSRCGYRVEKAKPKIHMTKEL